MDKHQTFEEFDWHSPEFTESLEDIIQRKKETREQLTVDLNEINHKLDSIPLTVQDVQHELRDSQESKEIGMMHALADAEQVFHDYKRMYVASQSSVPAVGFFSRFSKPEATDAYLRIYSHKTLVEIVTNIDPRSNQDREGMTRDELSYSIYTMKVRDSKPPNFWNKYEIDPIMLADAYTSAEIDIIAKEFEVPEFMLKAINADFAKETPKDRKLEVCRAICIYWSVREKLGPTVLLPLYVPTDKSQFARKQKLYERYEKRVQTGYMHKILLQYIAGRHKSVCTRFVDFVGANKLKRSLTVQYTKKVVNKKEGTELDSIVARDGLWSDIEQMCTSEDVRFVVLNITLQVAKRAVGHSNFVIIDRKSGLAEYYDPMGHNMYAYKTGHSRIIRYLHSHLSVIRNLNYKKMIPTLEMGALQKVQNIQRGMEPNTEWQCNTCQIWSYWYADVRLMYPDVPRYELLCKLQSIMAVEKGIAIEIFEGMRNFVVAATPNLRPTPEWEELKKRTNEQLQFVRNVPFSHFLKYPTRQREAEIQSDMNAIKSELETRVKSLMQEFIQKYREETNIGWDLLHVFGFWSDKLKEGIRDGTTSPAHTLITLQGLMFKNRGLWKDDQQLATLVNTEIQQNNTSLARWFGDEKVAYKTKLKQLRAYMDNGARMSGVYAILKGLGPAVADEDADELSEILMENYGSWVIDENISRRAVEDWMIQMQFNRSILKQVNTVTSDDIETYMGWCKEISTSDPVGQVILADRLFKVVEVAQEQRIGFRNLLESGIFQKMFTSMFRNFNEHKFNKSVDVLVHLTKTSKVECRYTLGALTSLQRLLEVHKNLYRGKSASVDSFKVLVDDMERNCPSN